MPRLSARAYQRVTGLAVFAVTIIIITGAGVRLTGSGLGCSQWPTCEDDRFVPELELHGWIEFGNRLFTGVVSLAVILAVLGSLIREQRRRDLTWLSLGLVAGVAAQAVIGGLSVLMELAPGFVSAHFLASIVLVWNAVVLHHRAGGPGTRPTPVVDRGAVRFGRLMLGLSCLVLFTGTFVTGTGPHAGDDRAQRYDFATISEVTRVHAVAVWVFLAVTLLALWHLHRTGAPEQVDARARLLVAAIVFQGGLGYAQYAAGVPPYLVILHVLGSVLVFIATLRFHLGLFTRPEPATISLPPEHHAERPAPEGEPAPAPAAAT
jgi:heme a synthase